MRWLAALFLALIAAPPALAQSEAGVRDVAASAPSDVSVTIYRAPWRNGGSIQLDRLGGFAVIQEVRTVRIPAGRSRLRFEGVVDGILPESAIVTGLPGGVLEKNRDAALLSPSSLMRAVRGKDVTLKRTDPRTGKPVLVAGEIISAGPDGVVFKTAAGTEALRCTGMPETFRYSSGAEGLSARPTLSVMTRSARPITVTVTLTYIAEGFDWSANYTAHINPDGKTMDIGGWITLANGNSVSLPNARTQIVAGGLNRAYVQKFVNNQPQVIARCWPQQRTHEVPRKPERPYSLVSPYLGEDYDAYDEEAAMEMRAQRKGVPVMAMSAPPPPPPPPASPPPPPPPEQLGDLKLYRVPQRTTVSALGMKQTRLVEQRGVPFDRIHTTTIDAAIWGGGERIYPVGVILRTRNTKENKLGLPLPSGSFVIEQDHWGRTMRIAEPNLSDTAEGEKIELGSGTSPDVTVTRRSISRTNDREVVEVEIANAAPYELNFELKLPIYGNSKIVEADQAWEKRDGTPLFALKVPANGTVKIRYTVTLR